MPTKLIEPAERIVTLEDLLQDETALAYVEAADAVLEAIGYTEHGIRHAKKTGKWAREILQKLGYEPPLPELAAIAGFFHDAGNVINRHVHAQSGALMAMQILTALKMPPRYIGVVMAAIGHHDESDGLPVSPVSAAVIIADKADVHRSRVRLTDPKQFDIHDRINYSVTRSTLAVDPDHRVITLELEVDTSIGSVMEFFEIFTERMILTRKAVEFLGCQFRLVANHVELHGASRQ
ncbi:hypothetical protein HRbin10_01667 [bacterium HR10]|nr:hypothetical protein HRbin10_01667 [bacterium HR10]